MNRDTAFALLGGTVKQMAKRLNCSPSAVYSWPKEGPLSREWADRVLAATVRLRAELLRAQGEVLHPLEEDAVALGVAMNMGGDSGIAVG